MPAYRRLCRNVPQYGRDKVVTFLCRLRHRDSSKPWELLPSNTEDLNPEVIPPLEPQISQTCYRSRILICVGHRIISTISCDLRIVIKEFLDICNVFVRCYLFCLSERSSVTFWPLQNLRTLPFIIVSGRNIFDCDACFFREQAVGAYGSFIVSTSSFYTTETSVALHKFRCRWL